jgi:ligand-binding sensor domain-containing protein
MNSITVRSQKWTNYTTSNTSTELCNNYVNVVVVDSKGNKWIGTKDGLSRYNGQNWKTYTEDDGLANNYVLSIAVDSSDNIWIGTFGGISSFDGQNWTKYLDGYEITSIAIDSLNNKWFGSIAGIWKFDDKDLINYNTSNSGLSNDQVFCFSIDKSGNKWMGTSSGGISKFDDKEWKTYSIADGLPANGVYYSTVDIFGNLWFGTTNGVTKYDGVKWTTYTNEQASGLDNVSSVFGDSLGNVWFGIYGGYLQFDGINWTTYKAPNNIHFYGYANTIMVDNENAKWIGAAEEGLVRIDSIGWRTYKPNGIASNQISVIASDKKNNHWFGTFGNGLSKFDGSNWITYDRINSNIVCDSILSIVAEGDSVLWIGTTNGLSKFDGVNWTTFNLSNSGIIDNRVNWITIDSIGNKWLSCGPFWSQPDKNSGISKFDGMNWINYNTANSGIISDKVLKIAIDLKGCKWVCTADGISKYNDTTWTNYNTSNGLLKDFMNVITVDHQNNIWVGSNYGGVSKFDGKNWVSYLDGGLSNGVNTFCVDSLGKVWAGTYEGGIMKFDDSIWIQYPVSPEGIKSRYVTSIITDRLGLKWFASMDWGVSEFDQFFIVSSNKNVLSDSANNEGVIKVTSEGKWGVSCDKDWIILNKKSGLYNDSVTLSLTKNELAVPRIATVTISSADSIKSLLKVAKNIKSVSLLEKKITIIQKAGGDGFLTLSINTLSIDASSNIKTFDISSNTVWKIKSNQIWLTTSSDSGSSNATITLSAQSNPLMIPRDAIITVSGIGVLDQLINVTQDQGTDITTVDNENVLIYPNPAYKKLFLKGLGKDAIVKLYDINGQILIGWQIADNQIDINNLANGLYYIVICEKNKKSIRKFVKR